MTAPLNGHRTGTWIRVTFTDGREVDLEIRPKHNLFAERAGYSGSNPAHQFEAMMLTLYAADQNLATPKGLDAWVDTVAAVTPLETQTLDPTQTAPGTG